jgi:hypothetical protein
LQNTKTWWTHLRTIPFPFKNPSHSWLNRAFPTWTRSWGYTTSTAGLTSSRMFGR